MIREETLHGLLMRLGIEGHSWCFDITKIIIRAYKSLTTHACISWFSLIYSFVTDHSDLFCIKNQRVWFTM